MGRGEQSKIVKKQLFLQCGCVSMFDLKPYSKKRLQLHHLEKYCITRHTVIMESALVFDEDHKWLHSLENLDPYLYYLYNEKIWNNKLTYEELKSYEKIHRKNKENV